MDAINKAISDFLIANNHKIKPKYIFLGREEFMTFKKEISFYLLPGNQRATDKIMYMHCEVIQVLKDNFLNVS